jgi:hypothetical protein
VLGIVLQYGQGLVNLHAPNQIGQANAFYVAMWGSYLIWLLLPCYYSLGDSNGRAPTFFSPEPCLLQLFFASCVSPEVAGGGKFTQLVTYHEFGNIHRDKLVAIVYSKGLANEIGRNGTATTPGFDNSLLYRCLLPLIRFSSRAWRLHKDLF